jgi:hypothetical protein
VQFGLLDHVIAAPTQKDFGQLFSSDPISGHVVHNLALQGITSPVQHTTNVPSLVIMIQHSLTRHDWVIAQGTQTFLGLQQL